MKNPIAVLLVAMVILVLLSIPGPLYFGYLEESLKVEVNWAKPYHQDGVVGYEIINAGNRMSEPQMVVCKKFWIVPYDCQLSFG